MKINQRLILGFLGSSLFLVFVGYISIIKNSEIKHSAVIVSEGIKQEFQGTTDMSLALQETHLALHELIEAQELAELTSSKTKKAKTSHKSIEKIKQSIAKFENSFLYTQKTILTRDIKAKELQTELLLLNQLKTEFLLHKNDINELIVIESKTSKQKLFKLWEYSVEKRYEQKLLPLLSKYRQEREQELINQLKRIIESINAAERQIIISTIFTLIATVSTGSLIARSISKPLSKLKDAAEQVGRGKFSTRVNIKSTDEVGILANAFNQMADDLSKTTVAKSYIDRVINSMTDTLIVINSDTTIVQANQAAIGLLGYTEKELSCKPISDILTLNFYQLLEANTLKEKCGIANAETVYLTKGGGQIPVSFSATVMQDTNQEIQGIVCVAHDITKRKEAEKINTLLATAVAHAADAIEITDAAARYEYVNPAFEKITGYKHSEVLGKTPASLLRSGKYDDAFYQKISDTLSSGQIWSGNYIGKRKDGTLYHQEVTISPVSNAVGTITHHVAVKRDITERQKLEERLQKINECFLNFGTDPIENINRLTALFGELLGATCTLYNRFDEGMLCSVGQWQTPAGYNPVDKAEGHICCDVIQQGSDKIYILHDLLSTAYGQTDPKVIAYQLDTYIGKAVRCSQKTIGSLCALYQSNYIPNELDSKIVGIIAAAIAVEEERRAMQESLRESEERYALAARAANDGLWDWNLKTNKVYFSPRSKAILGYGEEEIGNGWQDFFQRVHPQDIEPLKAAIASHLQGLTPHFEKEYRVLHQDGQYRWILCRGLATRDKEGKPYRFAGSQTDITQRKQTESQLLHQAYHDALTGLPNRLLFMERLEYALEQAKWGTDYVFAVLFLDLDRFKIINDSLGHALGDQLLVAIAHRLEACLRPTDTVSRLSGDEFAILLEDIKDLNEAKQVAERIQKQLSLPFHLDGQEVFTAASIGIVMSHESYEQPEDLLRNADTAMYRAKLLGKARYEVFDRAMHQQAMARLQLESDLRRALERQELQVYYQPIVSLHNGRMAGFEALVRWQHPQKGFVSPAEFIPLAEETGLIIPLGWYVLQQACQQMDTWLEKFPLQPRLTVSVNISSKQFAQPNLIQKIEQILQQIGLPATHLKLEITESVLIDHSEAAVDTLKQLKALGIGLSIDDFGTGYSSLSYLHRMPIDTLKIDRSFVNDVDRDPEKIEIIRTIIALAWNLGMSVVAEGVETKKQMYQLQGLRCEFAQGYLFSKPVDSQAAEALISSQPRWDKGLELAAK